MRRSIVSLLLVSCTHAAEQGDMSKGYKELSKEAPQAGTCQTLKNAYKAYDCCGHPDKQTNHQLVPMNPHKSMTPNPCEGTKPTAGFENKDCTVEDTIEAIEQSGANVTKGFEGLMESASMSGPIKTSYFKAGLCPVNVHWHLGAEHYSVGEYDENGVGSDHATSFEHDAGNTRRLADTARLGFRCHHYKEDDERFEDNYKWQHCADMHVGETYEVHWPHSTLGACGTPNQYQTPFYDGVFCNFAAIGNSLKDVDVAQNVGVQAQVFTIINDEDYYYPDLMRGWIQDGDYGADIAYYTGSTTGTSRSNKICSSYAPITWQVDRKCHLISASSFDKMCADMKSQKDDMSGDLYPHGARELVWQNLTADNLHRRV